MEICLVSDHIFNMKAKPVLSTHHYPNQISMPADLFDNHYINGLVQHCSNSSALVMKNEIAALH